MAPGLWVWCFFFVVDIHLGMSENIRKRKNLNALDIPSK